MTPNPQPGPVLAFGDVDDYQRRFCARRSSCLEVAAVAGWLSLDCRACQSYEPLRGEALRIEVVSLVALGEVLAQIAHGRRNHLGDPRQHDTEAVADAA